MDARWDFFVSYTSADQGWAEWIAWELENAGYQVLFQAWDFVPGTHWTTQMGEGVQGATRTLAILSQAYLRSVYGQAEWEAAFRADPRGFARKLIPVRIEDCPRPGLLGGVVSFDLFGHSAAAARDLLLGRIDDALKGRAKPSTPPPFPSGSPRPSSPPPESPATNPGTLTPPDRPAPPTAPAFPDPERTDRPARNEDAVAQLTARRRAILIGHTDRVWSVAFAPDGATLASASGDGSVRLWDLATNRQTTVLTGHGDAVLSLAFAPDGDRLATGGRDGSVRLWDVPSARRAPATARRAPAVLTGHTGSVLSVAFAPGGVRLASAGMDGSVRLWHVRSGVLMGVLPGPSDSPVLCVAFSPAGDTVAVGTDNGSARLVAVADGGYDTIFGPGRGAVSAVAFSPDGTTLATAGSDQKVTLWTVATFAQSARMWGEEGDDAHSLAFAPDGGSLVTGGPRGAFVWAAGGRPVAALNRHPPALTVAFAPDGATVATGGSDGAVRLWDLT